MLFAVLQSGEAAGQRLVAHQVAFVAGKVRMPGLGRVKHGELQGAILFIQAVADVFLFEQTLHVGGKVVKGFSFGHEHQGEQLAPVVVPLVAQVVFAAFAVPMLQAIGLPVVLQALRDAGGQLRSGRILDATAVAAQAATEQQGKGQAEYGFHGVLRWGIERCIITARLWARQTFAAGGRSGLPAAAKRCRYWARQAASLLAPPSGVVTGPAKRRRY